MGVCGDNCLYCPRYIATRGGKAEDLEKVKGLWVRLGLREPSIPATDLACYGCTPQNKCAYNEIRTCAYERGIDNCGLCDAYACELVKAALAKSDTLRSRACSVSTSEEMELLNRAYFSKEQNLDQIRLKRHKKNKP